MILKVFQLLFVPAVEIEEKQLAIAKIWRRFFYSGIKMV